MVEIQEQEQRMFGNIPHVFDNYSDLVPHLLAFSTATDLAEELLVLSLA